MQVRVLAGSESPREGLDIDYRRLSSIVYQQQQQRQRQALSALRCIDAGGVGAGRLGAAGTGMQRAEGRGRGQRAAGREGAGVVKRKAEAVLGNGQSGVLAAASASASASAVEVGRTAKPQHFGRGRQWASPLRALRSACAREHASTQAPCQSCQRPGFSAACRAALGARRRAATPCSTLRDVSLLCVCPPGASSPPCHLVCPGELPLRAACCVLPPTPRRKRQASSCTNAAHMLTRALQHTTGSSMQPRRSRYVPLRDGCERLAACRPQTVWTATSDCMYDHGRLSRDTTKRRT